jgi:predicted Zn-dependent peptidase
MYKLYTLPNGLDTVIVPMPDTRTATVLVMVGTGSKYESKENNGISHFLEHMFFKGTKNRPNAMTLASELDGLGAEYNAFTSKEYTGYWVKTEAGRIEQAMDIVSDMLLAPKLSSVEINREKGVIIEELNMYQDNPMYYIEDVFEECLYGNTPAGWDTIGTRENIVGFTRKDFTRYLESQYAAHNTFVCVAGGVAESRAKTLARKYFAAGGFGERGKKFLEKEPVEESQRAPQLKIHYKKTGQAHISLGVRAYPYDHKDRTAAKFISILLGGSMSSRLFSRLRERNGLAYYVRTEAEFYTDSGYLTTRAGVPVDKVGEAIRIILEEYRKLKRAAVPKAELERNKDLLRGRTVLQLESSDAMVNWFGRQAVLLDTIAREEGKKKKLRLASPKKYLEAVNGITAKDIKRTAQDIFTSQGLNLALIGPFKNKASIKRMLKI